MPPCIDTTSLSHPLFDCQHSQASYASITSSATCFLSPRPSGAHIIGFGSCRHHTVVDSLLVRFPFSSLQRFIDLISSYHRNFSLSTEFLAFLRFYSAIVLICTFLHLNRPRLRQSTHAYKLYRFLYRFLIIILFCQFCVFQFRAQSQNAYCGRLIAKLYFPH